MVSSHLLLPSCCMTSGSQSPPPLICVWSPRSTRDSAASLPQWACSRGGCLPHLSSPTIQTALVREKIKEKKRNKNPSLTGEECINPPVCGFHLLVTSSLCFKTKPAGWYSALHSQGCPYVLGRKERKNSTQLESFGLFWLI